MMRIKDVPVSPAYLVFHDAFSNGAMDIYPFDSFTQAGMEATRRNEAIEQSGADDCGGWKAYEKLPRVRVYRYHAR